MAVHGTFDWDQEHHVPGTIDRELEPPIPLDALDVERLLAEQQSMELFPETSDPESGYEIIDGLMYSTLRPQRYVPDHPRIVLPPSMRTEVITWAYEGVWHMAYMKMLGKVQGAYRCLACLEEGGAAGNDQMYYGTIYVDTEQFDHGF